MCIIYHMQRFFSHIRDYLRWYLLSGLIILSAVLWLVVLHENREGFLTFAVLDVGQGDSLFIESPTGTQVLVDGGPNNSLMKEISKVLPWYDRHIDMLVITNPDRDHYEGFIPLLDKYSTEVVLEPGTTNPNEAYKVLEDKIIYKKIPKILARRGQRIILGGGAYLEILFPDRDISGVSPNDGSIIMKLVYGETSILLTGDSTNRIEEYILKLDESSLNSDILKVAHHGSKTSSDPDFVLAVSPKWAVISSGEDNSYGHPHKETLETLKNLNVETYNTCNNGTIIFKSDGKSFVLQPLKASSGRMTKNENIKEAVIGCKAN